MLRKSLATVLGVLLLFPITLVADESSNPSAETKRVEKLRKSADTLRREGKKAVVVFNDQTKVSGQITALTDDGFTLQTKNGEQRQSLFTNVRSIKKSGLHPAVKVAIGVGALFGAVGIMCAAGYCGD
jgi:hypothetical protein